MTLLPYDLTFKSPIHLRTQTGGKTQEHKLESKNGFLLKIEHDNITSCADVSPLEHLSTESYKDVHIDCKKINTSQIFSELDSYLSKKENEQLFKDEKFLDFDFSKHSTFPSVRHALSCLFSDYYRQKLKITLEGKTHIHGFIPNSLIKAPEEDSVKKAIHLEKIGFESAKLKIGSHGLDEKHLAQENQMIRNILNSTKKLKLRLDANQKFQRSDYKYLLKDLDLSRIDYIEEPVEKSFELVDFYELYNLNIAIDENIRLLKDINIQGVKYVVLKPTLIGDYYTIKQMTSGFKKRGISAVLSSSFESQVGIYQIAQLAYVINPKGLHGLDTYDCFLEQLAHLEVDHSAIVLKKNLEIRGPIYV